MAEATYDWEILEIPGVLDVIDQAAAKVSRQFNLEVDDLAQEARVRVCNLSTNLPECAYGFNGLHLGTLQYRLEQDLVDIARVEVGRRDRNTSYEQRYNPVEGEGTYAPRPAHITIRQEVGGYTRELVESLIPAVWDESFCYGIRVENAPDADMPRGWTNKATGNTLAAHIADIKTGWEKAPLSLNEKRALLLGYGLDWTQEEIAEQLGVSHQSISNWLYSGVGKIVATLNGDSALLEQVSEPALAVAA